MKSIKMLAAACLAVGLLSFGAFGLTGCGPSAEEVVRQGVADELERLKTHDPAIVEELAADASAGELSVYGIEPQEFIGSYLDGFDYRIDGVTVDGDTATATVVLTCKKFDAFAEKLMDASAELALDEEAASLDEDALNEKIGATVLEVLASVEATESEPVELPFERTDNTWSPAAGAEAALSSALFAG